MKNVKISEYFEADHDRLDDLFKNFQRFQTTDHARAKEYFVAFKFGLQRHIIWEEEVLFPLFEEKTGIYQEGPTQVMRIEHREIIAVLEALDKFVHMRNMNTEKEEAALVMLLRLHNEKEENILYPALDRLAKREDQEKVFEAMKSIPEERYMVSYQPV
jgi:regulator of cell morphogenesis and NO signaling